MLSARRACMAGGRKPLLRAGVTARVRSRGDGGAAVGPGSGQPPQHQPRPTHLARARSRPHSLCTPGTALPNSASALDDGAAPDSDLNLAGARPRIRAQLERGTARHVLTLRSSGPCARRCVVSTVQLHTHACCVCAYNSSIKMWSVYAMSGRSVGGACGDLKYRVQCGTTCSIRRDGNLTHDTCRVAESGTAPHVRHHRSGDAAGVGSSKVDPWDVLGGKPKNSPNFSCDHKWRTLVAMQRPCSWRGS